MNRQQLLWWGLGGFAVWYIATHQNQAVTAAQGAASLVESYTVGWKNAGEGPTWVPILNEAEQQYGLPADLLAATAFQESSFIENVIRGLSPSSDGLSLGIMQLQMQYYPGLVGPTVPVPYSDQNVSDQINAAAQVFAANYAALHDWPATVAAWNQGLSGVQRNGITSTAYVAKILANAPVAAA